MKKLLSILAAVGLTATAGASVVACGGDKDVKPKIEIEKSNFSVELGGGNIEVPITNAKDLDIKVKSNDSKIVNATFNKEKGVVVINTIAIGKTTIDVTAEGAQSAVITFEVRKEATKAQGASVAMQLTETKDNEVLKDKDKKALTEKILTTLNDANKDAVVNDAFVINLDNFKVAHGKEVPLSVEVKRTSSTQEKAGLKEGTITVALTLNAVNLSTKDANTATLEYDLLESRDGDQLTPIDKTNIIVQIIEALKQANQDAVINADTFEFEVPEVAIRDVINIKVKVHATESTPTLHGLNEGEINFILTLKPIFKQIIPNAADVAMTLMETHEGELLTPIDKSNLKVEVLEALKKANPNAVINDDTFELLNIDSIIPRNDITEVLSVRVHATESTTEKPGLIGKMIFVKLNLNPLLKTQDAKGIKIDFELENELVDEQGTLDSQDVAKLKATITDGLKQANTGAVIKADTFVFSIDGIKVNQTEVKVQVNATASTTTEYGLNGGEIKVELAIHSLLEKVYARSTNVELELQETGYEQDLTANDQAALKAKIIEELMEVNTNANTNDGQAFEVNLAHIQQNAKSTYVVVTSTKSTAQKHGLMASVIKVNLDLTSIIKKEKVNAEGVNVDYNLSETNPGEVITDNDKTLLKVEILDRLYAANSNAVINNDTFEIDLTDLTLNTQSIKVKVHATESTVEVAGLNEGEVDVTLTLHPIFKKVDLSPVNVQLQLKETKKDQNLTDNDKKALKEVIIETLKAKNSDVVITDSALEFNFKELKADASSTEVTVHATTSTNNRHGLNEGSVIVGLTLIPAVQDQVDAKDAAVADFQLTETKKDQPLADADKATLATQIVAALTAANPDVVIDADTFTDIIWDGVTAGTKEITVNVKATASTIDKAGLKEGTVKVTVNLIPAVQDQVAAKDAAVADFQLTETKKDQPLADADKATLATQIVAALTAANPDVVIDADTFTDIIWDGVTAGTKEITVNVKATASTIDKAGLKEGTVKVTVNLIPAVQDQVAANDATIAEDFQLSAKAGEPLTDTDKEALTTKIVAALTAANPNVVIDADTFTNISWDGVTSGTKEITVNVKATTSTVDQSGLKEGTAKVTVNLIPAVQDQVAANDATIAEDFQLSAKAGEPLTDTDKEALTTKVLEALKEANKDAIIIDGTFTINWEGVTADSNEITVSVKATESTIEKSGLKEGTVKVTVNLIPAMQDQVAAKGAIAAELQLEAKQGQELTVKDKEELTTKVLEALKEANKDAIIVDGTFTINWEGVTADSNEITVSVKATESTIEKSGLKEGTVKVTVNLIPAA